MLKIDERVKIIIWDKLYLSDKMRNFTFFDNYILLLLYLYDIHLCITIDFKYIFKLLKVVVLHIDPRGSINSSSTFLFAIDEVSFGHPPEISRTRTVCPQKNGTFCIDAFSMHCSTKIKMHCSFIIFSYCYIHNCLLIE